MKGQTAKPKPKKKKKAAKPRGRIDDVKVWCIYDELMPVKDILPNPDNPNRHPHEQIQRLKKIIVAQGWRNAITVSRRSGFIVKGHARLTVAQLIGAEFAPVEFQDYETDADEIADLLADNIIAELAIFDEEAAAKLFDGLKELDFDLELTGVDPLDYTDDGDGNGDGDGAGASPEIEFTAEIMLEHNYIVLYFDNPFDWQVALEKFKLRRVKDLIPRKNQPVGIGRVVKGAAWLKRIK